MTSIHSLTIFAIAAAIVSAAAVVRPVQAAPEQTYTHADHHNLPRILAERHGSAREDQHGNRDDRRQRSRGEPGDRANPTLVTVVTGSLPDQPAYGWQYFTDPRAAHAVVISPRGEYFASFGRGLRQVTGPTGQVVSAQPPANN